MAGLALYGDLGPMLTSADPVSLRHRLESVKILPPVGANDPDLYGAITAQATSRPEIRAPLRRRVFSMAVTALADGERGHPPREDTCQDKADPAHHQQHESGAPLPRWLYRVVQAKAERGMSR